MNFKELIRYRSKTAENIECLNDKIVYAEGALMARDAIVDLLIKINDENYNTHGEHINQSCREEAETIERIINLIKHGNDYE